MTLILDVHAGSIVFLDCGCQGYRMPSRPDGEVLVIVEWPCEPHTPAGRPQFRYLDPLASVSPFVQALSDDGL
jgi:hypothetical protein